MNESRYNAPEGKKKRGVKRNDDQWAARRNAIIDAAEEVFAEKPFSKVSMRDIAKKAGISPALIYRYFPNQQYLFVEAFLRGVQDLLPLLDRCFDLAKSRCLEDAAVIFVDYLDEHEHYFKMMTHFMLDGSINEDLRERLNSIERSVLDQFDRMFGGTGEQKDVRLLSHAFFAALNGILITFRQHPGRTRDETRAHMERLARILTGIFAREVQDKTTVI